MVGTKDTQVVFKYVVGGINEVGRTSEAGSWEPSWTQRRR